MARADLLLKLVQSGISGNNELFRKIVEALIVEETNKKHHVFAERLRNVLKSSDEREDLNTRKSSTSNGRQKLENFLFQIHPKKTINDIILDDLNQQIIFELVEEHQRKDLLRSYNLEPRNKVILAGEPGNGKTTLAEVIATSLMIPFYVIRYDGIIGSYLGETATRLKEMFEFIRTQNCVLFFDEFDAIGKERGDIHETGEIKRVVSSLLLQIDSLPSYVVVVAATNHPELLDRAVWRRFQIRLELKKPTKEMIKTWISNFEKQIKYNLEYTPELLSKKLFGLNFAEIENFILDIQRKRILSLPEVDMKCIIDECLTQLSMKYSIGDE